jgi:hypothetical protein
LLPVAVAAAFEDPADEGGLVWLADQWWAAWVMLIVFCAIGFWMVRSLVLHRGRQSQIQQAARGSGMSYREQDGFGLDRVKFAHMPAGDGRGWAASHVVTLIAKDAAKIHAFDARTWVEVAVDETVNRENAVRRRRRGEGQVSDRIVRKYVGGTMSGAVAPLPINAPRLVIGRENMVSKVFAAATRLDLDVESEAFNRSYHVIGQDRGFASALLGARMIDLMVSTEGKISFEFFGSWLLLHTDQLEPTLFPGLARLADEMRHVVPSLVVERWGRATTP